MSFAAETSGERDWWRGASVTFALALFTAVVTAGANVVGQEIAARWKEHAYPVSSQ